MKRLLVTSFTGLVGMLTCFGQSSRLNDANSLGWFVYNGDQQVAKNWAIHTEFQWRRVDWVQHPQQLLARLGLVRTLTERIELSGGYTYFRSYRYGNYPEVIGQAEPESRLYEDISLKDQLGYLRLTHRLRLEQRWLGSRDENGQGSVQKWDYQNRIRYQLSFDFPLQGKTIDDGEWYLNAFDELFVGFGRNVDDNVFNQNRLSGGLGFRFTSNAKLELNYLYQIRQHSEPDPSSNKSVVELNNGIWINAVYNLDFTKKRQ